MPPAKRRRQDSEMELALSSNVEPRPSIFKLDVDCFDEIFDYISLEDLCSVGLTCKHMRRLAGAYFARNYPDQSISFTRQNEKITQETSGCETNFAPFIRQINFVPLIEFDIFGSITILRYTATQKYPSLKKIEFSDSDEFSVDHFACIVKMNILAQVTTIDLFRCTRDFMDCFLNGILLVDLCPNLRNLILKSDNWTSDLDSFLDSDLDLDSEWLHKNIPTLKRFETDNCLKDELEKFLRANRQIKKLSLRSGGCDFRMIEMIGLELDVLEYHIFYGNDTDKGACDQINALHEKGHIKNVHALFDIIDLEDDELQNLDILKDVSCITSAKVEWIGDDSQLIPRIALLVNLRKLYIDWDMTLHAAELLSKSLVNLQELHLQWNSLFDALPFARRLPKLRIIKAWKESKTTIDVAALSKERTKLLNAEVLQIYLADAAYREIRWTSVDLLLDMVKIRRLILTKGDDL